MNYPKGCLTAREKVPEHTLAALDDYLVKHWTPGDFLKAVLSNDLFNALGQAVDILPTAKAGGFPKAMLDTTSRTVPASQMVATPVLRPRRSYTISTGDQGLSSPENIYGCVHVPVMLRLARSAAPFAHIQGHRLDHATATRAAFAGRIESVDSDQPSPVPSALVLQLAGELAPTGITDSSGQRVVSHHIPDGEILDHNRLVFTDESSRQLVEEVVPGVGNPLVDRGDLNTGLVPILRSFLLSGQGFLRPLQLFHFSAQWAWRVEFGAIRRRSKSSKSKVDANRGFSLRHLQQRLIHAESDVIAARRCTAYRNSGGFHSEFARPFDLEPADLRERQSGSIPLKGRARELGRLRAMFTFERGIGCPLLPEVHKGGLQVPEALLRGHRTDLVQPSGFWLPLQISEFSRGGRVIDAFLILVPRLRTQSECPVVYVANRSESSRQQNFLFWRGVKAIFESPNHYSQYSILACKPKGDGASSHA